jgi:hypothetical protein
MDTSPMGKLKKDLIEKSCKSIIDGSADTLKIRVCGYSENLLG